MHEWYWHFAPPVIMLTRLNYRDQTMSYISTKGRDNYRSLALRKIKQITHINILVPGQKQNKKKDTEHTQYHEKNHEGGADKKNTPKTIPRQSRHAIENIVLLHHNKKVGSVRWSTVVKKNKNRKNGSRSRFPTSWSTRLYKKSNIDHIIVAAAWNRSHCPGPEA